MGRGTYETNVNFDGCGIFRTKNFREKRLFRWVGVGRGTYETNVNFDGCGIFHTKILESIPKERISNCPSVLHTDLQKKH